MLGLPPQGDPGPGPEVDGGALDPSLSTPYVRARQNGWIRLMRARFAGGGRNALRLIGDALRLIESGPFDRFGRPMAEDERPAGLVQQLGALRDRYRVYLGGQATGREKMVEVYNLLGEIIEELRTAIPEPATPE